MNVTTLNFSAIWLAEYDYPECELAVVLSALNQTSTIVGDTQSWFVQFFGSEGLVTLNVREEASTEEESSSSEAVVELTTSGGAVVSAVNVPAGMEHIVAWIT